MSGVSSGQKTFKEAGNVSTFGQTKSAAPLTMDCKAATPPGLAASSPNAARPETPAAIEAGRTFHKTPKTSAVSRSLDLASFTMDRPPRSQRLATAPSLSLRELEQPAPRSSSSAGATLMPQPPAVGSPAASSTSPRMRSVSSRNLPVRMSLSVSQLQDSETGEGPELVLQSPPLGASVAGGPLTPDLAQPAAEAASASVDPPKPRHHRTGSTSAPLLKLPKFTSGSEGLSAATSPSFAPRMGSSISTGATAAAESPQSSLTPANPGESGPSAAAASPHSGSDDDRDTDPWVALRAQCMAAYAGNLSSDSDGESEDNKEEYGSGPGRLMLLRHPSLVTRSLRCAFGEMTTTTTTTTAADLTVMPVAVVVTSQTGRPSPHDKASAALAAAADVSTSVAAAVKDSAPTGSISAVSVSRFRTRIERDTCDAVGVWASNTAVASIDGVGVPNVAPPVRSPPRDAVAAAPAASPAAASPAPAAAAARSPSVATVAKQGFSVVGASPMTGAAPEFSGPALSRARPAAALTMPPSQAQTGSAALGSSTSPATHLREASSLSPTASPNAASPVLAPALALAPAAAVTTSSSRPHRSECGGTSPTRSEGLKYGSLDNEAPRGQPGSSDGEDRSPFVSAAVNAAAALSTTPQQPLMNPRSAVKTPLQRHHAVRGPGQAPPPASAGTPVAEGLPASSITAFAHTAYKAASQESPVQQLELSPIDYNANAGRIAVGTVDKRVSESGGPVAAAGSILDVVPLIADPVRKRRISADGLSRHASRYYAGMGGRVSGGSRRSSYDAAQPPATPGTEEVASAAGKPQGEEKGGSPHSTVSGRAPLITALAFERAPWSHSNAALGTAAASAAQGPITSPNVAAAAAVPSAAPHSLSMLSSGAKLTPGVPPRAPGLPLGLSSQRPQLGIGQGLSVGVGVGVSIGGARSVTERMDDTASVAVNAATVVDKLRGYKSSKVLRNSLTPSLMNNPSGPATQDPGASSSSLSSIAVTGLSPPPMPQPKLGPFASMRTLQLPATPSTFLERLSGGAHSRTGSGPVNRRRSIASGGGGGSVAGDWTDGGHRHNDFHSRDGSHSLDGSGCQLPTEEPRTFPPRPSLDGSFGAEAGSVVSASPSAASWSRRPASLNAARSLKHILPRGPNGLPLAWSAIVEDGREGSDSGREENAEGVRGAGAGAGVGSGEGKEPSLTTRGETSRKHTYDEGKEVEGEQRDCDGDDDDDDDDEDDSFNMAHASAWLDLHQTC